MAAPNRRRGSVTVEFAVMYGAVVTPLLFGIVFVAQICWIWHSMAEFTRDGARYAATHCWTPGGENVIQYMQANVPPTIDISAFRAGGSAQINVEYFSRDPDSGQLVPFSCDAACSTTCIPDSVTVSISNYQFQRYATLLRSLDMPPFPTSQAIASGGCDETGVCIQ